MKTELSKRQPRFIPALNPRRKALEFSGVITQLKEGFADDMRLPHSKLSANSKLVFHD